MNMRGYLLVAVSVATMVIARVAHAENTCTLNDGSSGGSGVSSLYADSVACGMYNHVAGSGAAFGYSSDAQGYSSSAFGYDNRSGGDYSNAFGYENTSGGDYSNAFGFENTSGGNFSNAFGGGELVDWDPFTFITVRNTASGDYSNAFGVGNLAQGQFSSAYGALSTTGTGADYSIAFGAGMGVATSPFDVSRADGARVADNVTSAIAIGHAVSVNADDGAAMGHNTVVNTGAVGAVALGSDAIATEANTLSVGHTATDINPSTNGAYGSALQRRIVNLAAGQAATDAVNISQLEAVTALFGGGASFAGGVFTAPTFTIQGTAYNNVGAAFDAVDASITDLYTKVANTGGIQGPPGPQGPTTDAANMGQVQAGDAATLKSANVYADAQTQEALQSAKTYADAGDAATLASANAYTDSKLAAGFVTQDTFDQFQAQVGERFHQVDVRMARVGAMGQAMGGMAGAIAGGDRTPNRISAAVGSYGGQNAMAVGYSHLLPGHGSVLVGGTVAGGGGTGGAVGVSFGW